MSLTGAHVPGDSGHVSDHNALDRAVSSLGQGLINVKDAAYGAIGDGITDDSAAIQRAINAQQTGSAGAVVYLPPGTYLCNSQLVPAIGLAAPYSDSTRPLLIRGAGMDLTSIRAGATFGYGGIFAPGGSGSHPLVAQMIMSDLTLDGNYSGLGGSIAQPPSAAGALVSLPWPGTADTAATYNGRYHHFDRVKFWRPTGYVFQPTQGVKLSNCIFDGCGQPPETNHYDNLGSGQGDAIVIGCTWKDSAGNFADFVGANAGETLKIVMIGNSSYNHGPGGVYACGKGSVIVGNRLQNNSGTGGIGYDAWTIAAMKSGNLVANNHLTNINVNSSGLDLLLGDRVFGNISADSSGAIDFYQPINAAGGVAVPNTPHSFAGASITGDGTNMYLGVNDGGSVVLRPVTLTNTKAVFLSKTGGLVLFDDSAAQGSGLHTCTGVPSNSMGANGDYCFRKDGGAGAHIYFKSGGTWAAIV